MNFAEKAVRDCEIAMKRGRLMPRHIKNIIRQDEDVDVTCIEPFLQSDNSFIRQGAVEIIAKKGDIDKVVQLLPEENDVQVIYAIINSLSENSQAVECLVNMLNSDDNVLKHMIINAFRKAGRTDCLINLIFDRDNNMVKLIKGYIEGDGETKTDSN